MRIALISDTHMPSRETEIPTWVEDEVRAADHTIHVGDFDSPEAYQEVSALAGDEFTAVKGNMDPESLDLPVSVTLEFEDVTFVAIHGTGPTDIEGYFDLVAETTREEGGPDAIGICGHTHGLMDEVERGVRMLNPGSATGADPADEATMMVLDVEDGDLDVIEKRE